MMASVRESRPKLWLAVSNGAPASDPAKAPRRGPPEPSLDDAQLLRALRSGDPSAATALHDRARPVVDRTIARLLGRGDRDREDVTQHALIEIVLGIERFRGDCPLDAWCSTVSAHVVYKHLRRRQTERGIFGALDLDEHEPRSSVHAARDAIVRGVVARVRAHLEQMDQTKAWAFVLHDVCGYDLKEIAEITGASVAAAQTRLTRGRRELHERIAADPELADRLEGLGVEP
jgi:RNA polymerase sigma-70 factor (ECF subfamily)